MERLKVFLSWAAIVLLIGLPGLVAGLAGRGLRKPAALFGAGGSQRHEPDAPIVVLLGESDEWRITRDDGMSPPLLSILRTRPPFRRETLLFEGDIEKDWHAMSFASFVEKHAGEIPK